MGDGPEYDYAYSKHEDYIKSKETDQKTRFNILKGMFQTIGFGENDYRQDTIDKMIQTRLTEAFRLLQMKIKE